jgi:hypothetical protein
MPMIDASNMSEVSMIGVGWINNTLLVCCLFEYGTVVTVGEVQFRGNKGGLFIAAASCNCTLADITVFDHSSKRCLIELNDSSCAISNLTVVNSDTHGLVTARNASLSASELVIRDITGDSPLLVVSNTALQLKRCCFGDFRLSSGSVLLAQTTGSLAFEASTIANISTCLSPATLVSISNSEAVSLHELEFVNNSASVGLFDKCKLAMSKCAFFSNECLPGDSSLLLAIIVVSGSQSFEISDCRYEENRAVTGSLFIIDSLVVLKRCSFKANSAVQGAAIFASRGELHVTHSNFTSNIALSIGGCFSLLESSLIAASCHFERNEADEGGVISAVKCVCVNLTDVIGTKNFAVNGSFLLAVETPLSIRGAKVDAPYEKAVVIAGSRVLELRDSYFDCAFDCELIEEFIRPKRSASASNAEQGNSIFAVVFLILSVLILMFILRRRIVRNFNLTFRKKGKYEF